MMATMLDDLSVICQEIMGYRRIDLHQVWENHVILESIGDIDQVQRILVYADLLGEQSSVIAAEETVSVGCDAEAEIAHSYFEHGFSDDVGYRCRHAWVHLCRVVHWCVGLVVEVDEEDVGYEW